ncbi:MAG: hypothetical protein Q8T08_08255, partial [Ignavibacteria bacterium]|nr:hypothetical protein [Ignavibacteria bacterium]
AEFSQLKDLECYVKLPGDYPSTKLQTHYQKGRNKKEAFLLKSEKPRDYTLLTCEVFKEKKEPLL